MADTDQNQKPLTLRYLILRYIVVMVLTGIALGIVDFLLQYFFQYQSGAGVGIVAAIVPAMDAGQVFARHNKRILEKAEAWRLSAIFLAVNIAFGAVMILLLSMFANDGQMSNVLGIVLTPLGLGMMTVFLAIYLLATRFFFGSGAKNEIKRQTRASQKRE